MSRRKVPRKDEGLIVNGRRHKDDSTLFPGHKLQEYVTGVKSGSTLVGKIFECATEKLVGTERATTSGSADVCPDGVDEKRKLWIESKSTQRQHAFKVPIDQLEAYATAQYEAAMWETHYQVIYCLWAYHETRVTKARDWSLNGKPDVRVPTKQEFIQLVLGAARTVDVIDISILRRIRECAELELNDAVGTCNVKDYASWAGYGDGQPYYVLNIGHLFLARLREDPAALLVKLGLDADQYRWKRHNSGPRRIVINSVAFPVPKLDVFELVRIEGFTEYPEAKKDAPF